MSLKELIVFAFNKDLVIIMQSSLLKLFSFKIVITFFVRARQLSTNSNMLWFSIKLISFDIFSLSIFFPYAKKFNF